MRFIPFNSDRILRNTPKSSDEPFVLKREVKMISRLKDEVSYTPMTSEALISLRSLIEQDINVLNEPSRFCVQKLTNATQK